MLRKVGLPPDGCVRTLDLHPEFRSRQICAPIDEEERPLGLLAERQLGARRGLVKCKHFVKALGGGVDL